MKTLGGKPTLSLDETVLKTFKVYGLILAQHKRKNHVPVHVIQLRDGSYLASHRDYPECTTVAKKRETAVDKTARLVLERKSREPKYFN